MPAMLDDPDSPTIYRTSGAAPYPDPHDANPILPVDVIPRQVTLRDRVTVATIVPFSSRHQVPPTLLAYLSDQLNKEIENGDTYPMIDGMPADKFSSYWFQNFGAVMLLGNITSASEVVEGKDWTTECLGSFYIKPNYPGRSSHVCNAGFLVTAAARNRGVGRLMGEAYLDYAPKLGYTYSVFNLVYETNVASCRIWDALGFKRIGKVKGCGNLKSYPGQLIDAIIYGRDLGKEGVAEEEYVSEERFDKIKFYLKTGKYPAGADRAEKSRLRSAATHYKLVPATPPPLDSTTNRYSSGDGIGIGMGLSAGANMMGEEVVEEKLMLKDKEVISDPRKQYSIARNIHERGGHGGINKTTATIAERFHWVRIKETVSLVIKNCAECKESTTGKPPTTITSPLSSNSNNNLISSSSSTTANTIGRMGSVGSSVSGSMSFHHQSPYQEDPRYQDQRHQYHEDQRHHHGHGGHHPHEEDSYPHQGQQSVSPQVLNRTLPHSQSPHPSHHHPHLQNRHPDPSQLHNSQPNPYSQHPSSPATHQSHHQSPHSHSHTHSRSSSLSTLNHHNQQLRDQYMPPMPLPLDPQIMVGVGVDVHHLTSLSASLTAFGSHHHSSTHHEHTHLSEHLSEQESHSPLPTYGADVHEDQDQDHDGDLDMLRMSDQEDEDEDNGVAVQVVEMFGSGAGEGKKADSG